MNTLKSALKLTIILSIFWLSGCTYTQTFHPDFNSKKKSVLDNIKTTYGFENITFLGKKTSGKGGKHSFLTVKFINGKNLPADTAKMTELEKQLGIKVKAIIKNPKEFDSFIILFDKVVVDDNVTDETYTGHEFTLDELK
jgi:hypothetical protein